MTTALNGLAAGAGLSLLGRIVDGHAEAIGTRHELLRGEPGCRALRGADERACR